MLWEMEKMLFVSEMNDFLWIIPDTRISTNYESEICDICLWARGVYKARELASDNVDAQKFLLKKRPKRPPLCSIDFLPWNE